jgi:hypothetical protein
MVLRIALGITTILTHLVFVAVAFSASPEKQVSLFVRSSSNHNIYEFVPGLITWKQAKAQARARTFSGKTGHLVTITSAKEQTVVEELLDKANLVTFDQIWLGGSDAGREGRWKWVTGPEAGTAFWKGGPGGSPIRRAYSNWETLDGLQRQPDGDDFLSIEFNADPGEFPSDAKYQWNDTTNVPSTGLGAGYIVEYEFGRKAIPESDDFAETVANDQLNLD